MILSSFLTVSGRFIGSSRACPGLIARSVSPGRIVRDGAARRLACGCGPKAATLQETAGKHDRAPRPMDSAGPGAGAPRPRLRKCRNPVARKLFATAALPQPEGDRRPVRGIAADGCHVGVQAAGRSNGNRRRRSLHGPLARRNRTFPASEGRRGRIGPHRRQSPIGFGPVSAESEIMEVRMRRRYSFTSSGRLRAVPAASTSIMAMKTSREADGL